MFLKRLHMNRSRFLRYRFPDRPRRSPFVPVSKTQGPEVSLRPRHTPLSLEQLRQKRQTRKRVSRDPNAILSAATELGVLEERIGYKFENKLLGIAAFKTHNSTKLDLDGKKTFFEDQKRLALLGDEVLDLAICRTWYDSRRSRAQYSLEDMPLKTRAALREVGGRIGLQRHLDALGSVGHLGEAFEALLGAIYLDSHDNLNKIREVLKAIQFFEVDSSQVSSTIEKSQSNTDTKGVALPLSSAHTEAQLDLVTHLGAVETLKISPEGPHILYKGYFRNSPLVFSIFAPLAEMFSNPIGRGVVCATNNILVSKIFYTLKQYLVGCLGISILCAWFPDLQARYPHHDSSRQSTKKEQFKMVLEGYYGKSFLPYERVEHVPDLKELIRIAKTCWASNPEAPRLRRTPSTTLPQLLRDFTDLGPRDVFLTACKIEEQIRDHLRKLQDLPDWYDLPEHRDKVLPPWRIRQMSQEPETTSHDPPQPTQGTEHAPTAPKERRVHPWKQQSNLLPRMLYSSFSALAQSHDRASLRDPILYRRRLQRVGKALPYLYADHSVSRRVSYTSALLQDFGPRRRIVLKQRKPLWFLYGRNGVLSQRFRPHKEHLEAPTASPHYTIVPAPEPGRTQDDALQDDALQDDAPLPPGSAVEIVPRDPRTTHFVPVRTKQKQLQDEVYRHALHPRASATTRPEHDLAAEQGLRDPASSRRGFNRTVSDSIRIASLRARGLIDERFALSRPYRCPLLDRAEQTSPHDAYAPRHRAPVPFVNNVQAPPLQTARLADEYQELKDSIQKAMMEKAALEKALRDAEPRPGIKAAETWQAPPRRRRKESVAHKEKRRDWWRRHRGSGREWSTDMFMR